MTWIKRSELKDIEFQPLTTDSKKRTNVWDDSDKKFIKEGEKFTLDNGNELVVDEWVGRSLKGVSKKDAARFRASQGFIREVIIGSEKRMMDLPYSVETKLQKLMSRESEPLEFTYIIDKEGTGIATRYDVFKGDKVGLVDGPQGTIKPPTDDELKTCNGVDLLPEHIKILKEFKSWLFTGGHDINNKNIETEVLVSLQENGIDEQLAKDMINEHLK